MVLYRGARRGTVRSCFQCAGSLHCFGTKHPPLERIAAREKAAACDSHHKGLSNETVIVLEHLKGITRSKAEELVLSNKAVWAGHRVLKLTKV